MPARGPKYKTSAKTVGSFWTDILEEVIDRLGMGNRTILGTHNCYYESTRAQGVESVRQFGDCYYIQFSAIPGIDWKNFNDWKRGVMKFSVERRSAKNDEDGFNLCSLKLLEYIWNEMPTENVIDLATTKDPLKTAFAIFFGKKAKMDANNVYSGKISCETDLGRNNCTYYRWCFTLLEHKMTFLGASEVSYEDAKQQAELAACNYMTLPIKSILRQVLFDNGVCEFTPGKALTFSTNLLRGTSAPSDLVVPSSNHLPSKRTTITPPPSLRIPPPPEAVKKVSKQPSAVGNGLNLDQIRDIKTKLAKTVQEALQCKTIGDHVAYSSWEQEKGGGFMGQVEIWETWNQREPSATYYCKKPANSAREAEAFAAQEAVNDYWDNAVDDVESREEPEASVGTFDEESSRGNNWDNAKALPDSNSNPKGRLGHLIKQKFKCQNTRDYIRYKTWSVLGGFQATVEIHESSKSSRIFTARDKSYICQTEKEAEALSALEALRLYFGEDQPDMTKLTSNNDEYKKTTQVEDVRPVVGVTNKHDKRRKKTDLINLASPKSGTASPAIKGNLSAWPSLGNNPPKMQEKEGGEVLWGPRKLAAESAEKERRQADEQRAGLNTAAKAFVPRFFNEGEEGKSFFDAAEGVYHKSHAKKEKPNSGLPTFPNLSNHNTNLSAHAEEFVPVNHSFQPYVASPDSAGYHLPPYSTTMGEQNESYIQSKSDPKGTSDLKKVLGMGSSPTDANSIAAALANILSGSLLSSENVTTTKSFDSDIPTTHAPPPGLSKDDNSGLVVDEATSAALEQFFNSIAGETNNLGIAGETNNLGCCM